MKPDSLSSNIENELETVTKGRMIGKKLGRICLVALAAFGACKKVDVGFGQDFVDNEYTMLYKTDTFSVDLSSVYVDSFQTSGKGTTLVGNYDDTSFGKIASNCFFDVAPPTSIPNFDSTKLDSVSLILKLNKSYYGDTSKPFHIEAYRLAEKILLPEGAAAFFNNQSFKTNSIPLGQGDYVFMPSYTDTISIRLDQSFGLELLKKLQDKADDDLKTTAAFIDYFNGLMLTSKGKNDLVLGFTDKPILRVSYQKPGIFQRESQQLDFALASTGRHFNNITVDRSGLNNALKNIGPNNPEISSAQLGKAAYSQYVSGVMAKLKFPTLREILKVKDFAKVLSAKLTIAPVRSSYDGRYALPSLLRLSVTDQNNGFNGDIGTYAYNGSFVQQTGNLFIDKLYGDNTYYTYDISNFIKQQVRTVGDNNLGVLVVPTSDRLATQMQRVIFGAQNNPTGKMVLEVYYATVK